MGIFARRGVARGAALWFGRGLGFFAKAGGGGPAGQGSFSVRDQVGADEKLV